MTKLKAAIDVDYGESTQGATAACVLFAEWRDRAATIEHRIQISRVADYQPGQFYKRELPCILEVLEQVKVAKQATPEIVLVDGHVWLERPGDPGLGAHLHAALAEKIPVIGVAKSAFKGSTHARQVLRGQSQKPLFVTAIGIDLDVAASHVASMAGQHRLPTLLKRVDALARGNVEPR